MTVDIDCDSFFFFLFKTRRKFLIFLGCVSNCFLTVDLRLSLLLFLRRRGIPQSQRINECPK